MTSKAAGNIPGAAQAMRLAEVAVARLCHDLSGSLGAVTNGLELARAGDPLAAEALQLAADAAQDMSYRLKLARALWTMDAALTTGELLLLAAALPGRARLDTTRLADTRLAVPSARLLLALLLLAAESLHGAGTIILAGNPTCELLVVLEGLRAAWPADLLALQASPHRATEDAEPGNFIPRLVALLADAASAHLSMLLPAGPAVGPVPLLIRFPQAIAQAASPAVANA